MIRQTVLNHVDFLGLLRWREAISNLVDDFLACKDTSTRIDKVGMIYHQLARYGRLEITSILELFVWKMKIDEEESKLVEPDSQNLEEKGSKRAKLNNAKSIEITFRTSCIDRNACRINCGAEVVIQNVVSFLGDVEGVLAFDSEAE